MRAGNIAVLALIMIMLAVILIKAHFGRGYPLRGGFPSGHTASAFSLWVSLLHVTANPWLIGLGFLAAALVAASRLRLEIHTFGAMFFSARCWDRPITLVLFQVFYRLTRHASDRTVPGTAGRGLRAARPGLTAGAISPIIFSHHESKNNPSPGGLAFFCGCRRPHPALVPEISPPLVQEAVFSWPGRLAGECHFPLRRRASAGWTFPAAS